MPERIIMIFMMTVMITGCYYDNEEELYPATNGACGSTAPSYNKDVEPLIKNNCLSCHSSAANMGSVSLEGHAQVRNYAMNGRLYGAISHAQGFSPMPKGGAKLSDCNLAIIKRWIDEGSQNN